MQWFNDHVFAWQDIKRADDGDGESSGVDEALKPGDDVGWDDISFVQSGVDRENDGLSIQVSYMMLYHLNTCLTVIPRYYQTFLDRNEVLHSPMVAGSHSQYCDNLWTKRNLLPVVANHPLLNLFQSCNLQLSKITPPSHVKLRKSNPTVIPVVKKLQLPKQHLKCRHNLPKRQILRGRARRRQRSRISMSSYPSSSAFDGVG